MLHRVVRRGAGSLTSVGVAGSMTTAMGLFGGCLTVAPGELRTRDSESKVGGRWDHKDMHRKTSRFPQIPDSELIFSNNWDGSRHARTVGALEAALLQRGPFIAVQSSSGATLVAACAKGWRFGAPPSSHRSPRTMHSRTRHRDSRLLPASSLAKPVTNDRTTPRPRPFLKKATQTPARRSEIGLNSRG
jgi:hypothetical protein